MVCRLFPIIAHVPLKKRKYRTCTILHNAPIFVRNIVNLLVYELCTAVLVLFYFLRSSRCNFIVVFL